ncbi:MAG: SOS response-associated peptidase [Mycobacteriaceae bacterium]
MCGRFVVTTDPALLAARLDAVDETDHRFARPNYNVAPTTTIAAVVARHGEPGDAAGRRILAMRWGLLPPWVKADADGKPQPKSLLINARAETLTSSPAFRASARRQRCLVPMDGYYEWMPNPEPGPKTPFYMHRRDGSPILVAGLWSAWRPDEASAPMLTCTIVTTDAVGGLAGIHNRMPLMLDEQDWDRWLDPDEPAPEDLLAARADISGIEVREISRLVNRVANNGPELLEPVDRDNQPVGLF